MSDTKTQTNPQPHILSADQMSEAMNVMWTALQRIVAINNLFVQEMGKSTTLSPEDSERVAQWSRAVAKAHDPVTAVMRATDRAPATAKLN